MAQLIQNGDALSGTSNDSANILYSEPDGSSKNIQDKIEELDSGLEELNNSLTTTNTNMKKIKTYVGSDGKIHFVDSTGADSVLPFKSAPTLVGTYSGNQTINVSSVIGANDTVNNFIIELVSAPSGQTEKRGNLNDTYGYIQGFTVSKYLSGTNLIINGCSQGYGFVDSWGKVAGIQNINYKVWHF